MRIEPERALVRAATRWAFPALAVAFVIGLTLDGLDAAWSAAIGVAIVYVNLNAYGWSLARAAVISPTALAAVGMGGYVVRLAVIVVLLVVLDRMAFFSPLWFALAVVPASVFVLAYELHLLTGRWVTELWNLPTTDEPSAR